MSHFKRISYHIRFIHAVVISQQSSVHFDGYLCSIVRVPGSCFASPVEFGKSAWSNHEAAFAEQAMASRPLFIKALREKFPAIYHFLSSYLLKRKEVAAYERQDIPLDVFHRAFERDYPNVVYAGVLLFSISEPRLNPSLQFGLIQIHEEPNKGIFVVIDQSKGRLLDFAYVHLDQSDAGPWIVSNADAIPRWARKMRDAITLAIMMGLFESWTSGPLRDTDTERLKIFDTLEAPWLEVSVGEHGVRTLRRSSRIPSSAIPRLFNPTTRADRNKTQIERFNHSRGFKVVEMGSGFYGDFVQVYRERHPQHYALGFDPLDELNEPLTTALASENVVLESAAETRLDDNSVNVVYINMPDPGWTRRLIPLFLAEARRILVPGGLVVIIVDYQSDSHGIPLMNDISITAIREQIPATGFDWVHDGIALSDYDRDYPISLWMERVGMDEASLLVFSGQKRHGPIRANPPNRLLGSSN